MSTLEVTRELEQTLRQSLALPPLRHYPVSMSREGPDRCAGRCRQVRPLPSSRLSMKAGLGVVADRQGSFPSGLEVSKGDGTLSGIMVDSTACIHNAR